MEDKALLNVRVAEALGARWRQHPLDGHGRAVGAGEPYLWPSDPLEVHFKWAPGSEGMPYESRPRVVDDGSDRPIILRPADAAARYNGPDYAGDWNALGPLLVRYRIGISPFVTASDPPHRGQAWGASEPVSRRHAWHDTSPLIAACELILKLAAAGKLKK